MDTTGMTDLDLDQLVGLSPDQVRSLIPAWLGAFVAGDGETSARSAAGAAAVITGLSDAALVAMMARLANTGSHYGFFPADPAVRVLIRAYMHSFSEGSTVTGIPRLAAATKAGPVLLVCNHLAYCDTVLKDMVLARAGGAALADRLIAIAGPKVYGTPFRRMASLGVGTIKTAQSTAIAHTDGSLSPRAVAEIAVCTVAEAHKQMRAGGLVVLYGEGSRSRDQRLGPFIKAIRKYAKLPGCRVVPLALSGTDTLMPIGQHQMHLGRAALQIGEPCVVDEIGPMAAIAMAWQCIADMLPQRHRPAKSIGPWG
jgi:1-acyl-sn-glycerol-3-phosphate acyltransferase